MRCLDSPRRGQRLSLFQVDVCRRKKGKSPFDFPPMQAPASFNLTNVKEKIQAAIKANEGR
jgi:hypothetical protein